MTTLNSPPQPATLPPESRAEHLQVIPRAELSWRSEDLLGGMDEARITHGDQTYRLRLTLTGKLILTK